jgi:hypothetical protein
MTIHRLNLGEFDAIDYHLIAFILHLKIIGCLFYKSKAIYKFDRILKLE